MSKISVKKPFTVLVGVIMVIALGIVSLTKMTTDLLPEMKIPYLLVITTYPGASPEKVESNLTEPLESQLGTISGIKNVSSTSAENYSMVQLEFEADTDMNAALVKVSTALDDIKSYLPDECGVPSLMELSMDMVANEYIGVSYDDKDIFELSDFVDDELVPLMQRQDGVASVSTLGLVEKSVQIELNADKVAALNDKILASVDSEFADALEDMDEAKQQLIDSQKELDDGKQELIDSKNDLKDSEDELYQNKSDVEDGIDQLKKVVAVFDNATQKAQMEQLADNLVSCITARDQIAGLQSTISGLQTSISDLNTAIQGLTSLKSSLEALPDRSQALSTDLAMLSALQNFASAGVNVADTDTFDTALTQVNAAIDTLNSNLSTAQAGLDTANTGLKQCQQAKAGLSTILTTMNQMRSLAGVGTLKATADNITAADASTIKESWPSILTAAEAAARSNLSTLQTTLDGFDDYFDQINDGRETIDENMDKLGDSQESIDDGWESYYDGLSTYTKQKREALMQANADKLVNVSTLSQLIYAQNFEMPAGYIDDADDNSWLLKVGEGFDSTDLITDTVLCNIHDVGDVRIRDVADVTVIDNSDQSWARMNGRQSIILSVYKGSTASTGDVSDAVKEAIAEAEERWPGLHMDLIMDQGDYIDLIVNSVTSSMGVGAVLAIIVLAIFLKDFLPTLVVAISIPLSVLAAIVAMYFSGLTMNMLTLSGLALGIGMLVDNSIVVIENIYRLRGRGVGAPRAAVQGTRQVSGAIIASTLTTVCVFLPMIFTSGTVRQLIWPMCLSIIFCLLASLAAAETIVPAAGSTLLRASKPKAHPWFDAVQNAYGRLLDFCLRVKIVPLALAIGLLALSVYQVITMGIVMIPDMSSGELELTFELSEDMSREDSYKTADEVMDAILDNVDGIRLVGGMTSSGILGMMSSSLAGSDDYSSYQFDIVLEEENAPLEVTQNITAEINSIMADMPVEEYSVGDSMDMSALMSSGVTVNIYGNDLDTLTEVSEQVMDVVAAVPGFEEISNGQEDGDDVIHLIIDKNKAMSLGLSVAQIYQELADAITTEKTSTTVTIDGEEMDVVIKDETGLLTRENLMDYSFDVSVYDEDDDQVTQTVTLGELSSLRDEEGVASISRKNQSRLMTVTASVADGYNATLLSRELDPKLEAMELPSGYSIEIAGESDEVNDMVVTMCECLALGCLFIYLVMVAQFQSLLSPFIVLFTVPLAFTGGMFGLIALNERLSLMSLMGFVVLMGTVVNNGIVFVDYTNQLRLGGMERRAALIATGKTRMRPILMTALTTILAEMKLVMGTDMGSQMGKGMAIVIIGGLAYATLMTLFIVPVIYDLLFRRKPINVDIGSEDLDDVPDDAAEFIAEALAKQNAVAQLGGGAQNE